MPSKKQLKQIHKQFYDQFVVGEVIRGMAVSNNNLSSENISLMRWNYSETETIWRYLDLSKFLSLLENKQLYLTRLDRFEDKYEGEYPHRDFQDQIEQLLEEKAIKGKSSLEYITESDIRDLLANNKTKFFACCWHCNEQESYGMWKSYLANGEGVAIKTTVNKLRTAITARPESFRLSKVVYLDYSKDSAINYFLTNRQIGLFVPPVPGLFKRKEFEFEKEFRLIGTTNETDRQSLTFDIDTSALIEAVYISPFCAPWFGDLIKKLLEKYDLKVPVHTSSISQAPNY